MTTRTEPERTPPIMSDDRHIQFVKMHGIGNDYVYIDATREDPGDPVELARLVLIRF